MMQSKKQISEFDIAVAKRFKELRLEKNLSLQAVADAIGVSKNQVFRWENCENRMYVHHFAKYCEVLNIGISEFTNSIDYEESK